MSPKPIPFYEIFSSYKKLTTIIDKIKLENPSVNKYSIFKCLLQKLPKVTSPSDINRKLSIFNNISTLNPDFEIQSVKLHPDHPSSILMTNKKISKSNLKSSRLVVHYHSLGFVAGKPLDVVNPLSHFYKNLHCNKILIPGLDVLPDSSVGEIFRRSALAYNHAISFLNGDARSLILSGTSSGCLVVLKLLQQLQLEKKQYDPLPNLHFRNGPNLVHRPKGKTAGGIMAISPNYGFKLAEKSSDPFLSADVISVVNKIVSERISDLEEKEYGLESFSKDDTKSLSYMMNLSNESDPSFESLLRLREKFSLEENKHWFAYRNFANDFHLSPLATQFKENEHGRVESTFFLKNITNI